MHKKYWILMVSIEKKYHYMLDLSKSLTGITELDSILIVLADFTKKILEADRCSVFIYDENKQELYTKIAHGINNEIRINVNEGIAGYTALTKEIQIVKDAYNDSRFDKEIDLLTGYKTKNIISVPLIGTNGKSIGVLQALNKIDSTFDESDAEILLLFASYASSTIENAILHKKLRDSKSKIIDKLSTVVEYRDNDTSKHIKRVGAYSAILAKAYGLSREEIRLMKLAAPMHDTGKIGILDKILYKPEKLTTNEFDDMKQHTCIGYQILNDQDDPLLLMASIIAKEHHEKYDGSGYPLQLKGDEISIYGQIVSIADVFDALLSKRPYKEAWSVDEAIKYIVMQKGKSFNPILVDKFIEDIELIKTTYKNMKD